MHSWPRTRVTWLDFCFCLCHIKVEPNSPSIHKDKFSYRPSGCGNRNWCRMYMCRSINTSSSINWEANPCLLRRAELTHKIHAARTVTPRPLYCPIIIHNTLHSLASSGCLSISHIIHPSQQANKPQASQSMSECNTLHEKDWSSLCFT
jgi:hypothetical protein